MRLDVMGRAFSAAGRHFSGAAEISEPREIGAQSDTDNPDAVHNRRLSSQAAKSNQGLGSEDEYRAFQNADPGNHVHDDGCGA